MVWIWIVIVLIALIVIAAFGKVRAHITYSKDGHDDQMDMKIITLYGAFRYHYSLPVIKFKGLKQGFSIEKMMSSSIPSTDSSKKEIKVGRKDILSWYEQSQILIQHVSGFHHWLMKVLNHTHCTKFKWVTQIGLGDAVDTAVTTGLIWGIKANLLGIIFNRVKLDDTPTINVQPQFNQMSFNTYLECIIKIRLGYAMLAGLHLLVRIYKVKGGIRAWQNILSKA